MIPSPSGHLRLVGGLDDAEAAPPGFRAWWRVNGQRVCIHIWTLDQWARLETRPSDAQYYPCGVWCALRPDE